MPLERLQIDSVRCLQAVDVELDPRRNYLFGLNGAGKTSFLESIFLLGRGRSFRTRQTARLVRRGSDGLTVYGEVRSSGRRRRIGVSLGGGELKIRIDGEASLGMSQLAEVMAVHVMGSKLHRLIEAGPSERRRYVDGGVFHVEHGYLEIWRHYRRVLGQRNAALKRGLSGAPLAVWTRPVLAAAEAVHAARQRYTEELSALVEQVGGRLLDRPLRIVYRPGWRQGVSLEQALRESLERDTRTGFTQVGPHRADVDIRMDAGSVRDHASRGQQKLIAAALVLAQVRLFGQRTGRGGLLLVDDPAAELDAESLARLMAELETLATQLFLTGLSDQALRPRKGFPVFHVERGQVEAVV
ncbi:DNA replication/repair protein RecF [Candidatus Rariloculus sp.]|uniref:DNA replication/repair protein RecF n=1 Tax=Candidatus Rariloculus sp. TaxID=3101265 RepID=UPI003D149F83